MHNFLNDMTVLEIKNFTSAAATGIVETAVHDVSGYESVVAIMRHGTTSTANGLQALMGTASASASLSEVLNSYVPAISTGVGLELYRPQQYVQFQAVREASEKAGDIWVLGIGTRNQPATQAAARMSVRVLGSPTTGQTTST